LQPARLVNDWRATARSANLQAPDACVKKPDIDLRWFSVMYDRTHQP
jgi:hypothetical protein